MWQYYKVRVVEDLRQDYYNAHPIMYLLTSLQNYKIEFIAGYVTSFDSEIYDIKNTIEERDAIVQTALDKTGFTSEAVMTALLRYPPVYMNMKMPAMYC